MDVNRAEPERRGVAKQVKQNDRIDAAREPDDDAFSAPRLP
jgi:hypothetical protein